jgi:hypothetical protein
MSHFIFKLLQKTINVKLCHNQMLGLTLMTAATPLCRHQNYQFFSLNICLNGSSFILKVKWSNFIWIVIHINVYDSSEIFGNLFMECFVHLAMLFLLSYVGDSTLAPCIACLLAFICQPSCYSCIGEGFLIHKTYLHHTFGLLHLPDMYSYSRWTWNIS